MEGRGKRHEFPPVHVHGTGTIVFLKKSGNGREKKRHEYCAVNVPLHIPIFLKEFRQWQGWVKQLKLYAVDVHCTAIFFLPNKNHGMTFMLGMIHFTSRFV